MSVATHVQELRRKHEVLSAEVEAQERNPGADTLHIADLKKRKLRLKEEISRLMAQA
jgi:hypothetical protein